MLKLLTILFSAVVAAGLFLFLRSSGAGLTDVQLASGSLFGAPAPVIAAALAFPALYLLWEQSEM